MPSNHTMFFKKWLAEDVAYFRIQDFRKVWKWWINLWNNCSSYMVCKSFKNCFENRVNARIPFAEALEIANWAMIKFKRQIAMLKIQRWVLLGLRLPCNWQILPRNKVKASSKCNQTTDISAPEFAAYANGGCSRKKAKNPLRIDRFMHC